jgi:hypothetical protein
VENVSTIPFFPVQKAYANKTRVFFESINILKYEPEWRRLPKRHYSEGDFQNQHEVGCLLSLTERALRQIRSLAGLKKMFPSLYQVSARAIGTRP